MLNSINKLQFFLGGGVGDGLECWQICQHKEKKLNLLMITDDVCGSWDNRNAIVFFGGWIVFFGGEADD